MAQKEYGLSKAAAQLMMEILQRREKPEEISSRDTLYQQVRKRLDRIPRQRKQYKVHNGCLYVEDEKTRSLKRVLVKEDEPLAIWEAHIETLVDGHKIHHCAHATYRRLKQRWMGGSRRKCDPLRFCAKCRSENQDAILQYDVSTQAPATQSPCGPSMKMETTPEPDNTTSYVLLIDNRILWLYNAQTKWLHARAMPRILPTDPSIRIQDFQAMIDQIRSPVEETPPSLVVQHNQSFPWALKDMCKICSIQELPKHHELCQKAVAAVTSIRRELTAFSITDAVRKYNESLNAPKSERLETPQRFLM